MKYPEPLARVVRGGLVESIHRGHMAVVTPKGEIVDSIGDPHFPTYLRSAAKPFQAVPVIVEGAAARFSLTDSELAVMCGSHSGQEFHVEAVASILRKIGLDESALDCGVHRPSHRPTAKALDAAGEKPRPIHNNCSGKHAAMLALCVNAGWEIAGYIEVDHPVQVLIREYVAICCGIETEELGVGVDGCGVPVFQAPLSAIARGYSIFAYPSSLEGDWREALTRLQKACVAFPEMIAGDERVCTEAMRAAGGKVIAKTGAEASYGIALIDKGLGIAYKIEDGGMRALPPVTVEILVKAGAISEEAAKALSDYHKPLIKNHRRDTVGHIEPAIEWEGLAS